MHWLSKLLALAATSAVGTNAFESSIFTFHADQQASADSTGSQTVSEDVARLILELRMRSPLHSKLGSMEPDVVNNLDQYADSQFSLFGGSEAQDTRGRSIIFLEGLDEEVVSTLRKSQDHSIFVPHASPALVNDALEPLMNKANGKHCTYSQHDGTSQNSRSIRECLAYNPVLSHGSGLSDHDILGQVDSMETFVSKNTKLTSSRLVFETKSVKAAQIAKSLEATFADLAKTALSSNIEVTVVALPAIDHTQESAPVQRRSVEARSQSPAFVSERSSAEFVHSNLAPVCHASNSSCEDATNNCSGHGSCYLKFGPGNEDAKGNCYACKCRQTTVKNSDGSVKKIQWGGVACQKEDISSPFFLIASVTILVIVLAGSAIGMLFSMGSEPLPSVIGAGVGTSKTQS
ncbi:unnamed protein product [Penicillium manginii]